MCTRVDWVSSALEVILRHNTLERLSLTNVTNEHKLNSIYLSIYLIIVIWASKVIGEKVNVVIGISIILNRTNDKTISKKFVQLSVKTRILKIVFTNALRQNQQPSLL